MRNLNPEAKTIAALATPVAGAAFAAPAASVDDLVTRIKSKDDNVRGNAWQQAGPAGAPAIKALAEVMNDADFEVARSAKRAVWQIMHHAGRPGADKERKAVSAELIPLLKDGVSDPVRREAIWMASETSGDEAVDAVANLLKHPALQDDARCALERIPGRKSLGALRLALKTVPEAFRYAVAESLRKRGETVKEYPSRKLIPTKPTAVKPG